MSWVLRTPTRWCTRHNLASLAVDQNNAAEEAERLFREIIQVGGSAIGFDHPTVMSATRRLGALLLDQKKYPEAIDLLANGRARRKEKCIHRT